MTLPHIACLPVLIIAVVFTSTVAAAEHSKDSLAAVKKNVEDEKAVLVDVREKSEWDRGHIEGAVLLPLSELRNGIDQDQLKRKLPEKKILYVHCAIGKRAVIAGTILEDIGFEVRCLKPGYQDLLTAGFKKAKD